MKKIERQVPRADDPRQSPLDVAQGTLAMAAGLWVMDRINQIQHFAHLSGPRPGKFLSLSAGRTEPFNLRVRERP
jgi:hypothetical protein